MFLGIDTSNYTTSSSVYDTDRGIISNVKRLLNVKPGQIGLRQSDALFSHTVNLYDVISSACGDCSDIEAIGVSTKPRDIEGSYMPCFLAGKTVAECMGLAIGKPVFHFSHQAGHIAAALYSAKRLDLIGKEFIAFHFSGGTTEAVLCKPSDKTVFNCTLVSSSLDLKAGQAIDRIGVMLGLDFPAGKALDKLASASTTSYNVKPFFKDQCPSISGLENQCRRMYDSGESNEHIARYAVDYIRCVVEQMTINCRERFDGIPIIYAGGVMSNSIISDYIGNKFGGYFAAPEFSTDNASGVAVLTSLRSRGYV